MSSDRIRQQVLVALWACVAILAWSSGVNWLAWMVGGWAILCFIRLMGMTVQTHPPKIVNKNTRVEIERFIRDVFEDEDYFCDPDRQEKGVIAAIDFIEIMINQAYRDGKEGR